MWFDSVLGVLADFAVPLAVYARGQRRSGTALKAFTVAGIIVVLGSTLASADAQTVTLNLAVSTGDSIDGYTIRTFGFAGDQTHPARPAINDSGTLAFNFQAAGSAYFDTNGFFTQSAKLAYTGDVIDGKTLTGINPGSVNGGTAAINSAGLAAFGAGFVVGDSYLGIFTPNNLLAKTGDVIGGQQLDEILGNPAINDSGTVVFWTFMASGAQDAICTPGTVVAKRGDTIAGKQLGSLGFSPDINNAGTVAFLAYSPPGGYGTGIFTQTQLLVKKGDVVDGATIYSLGDPVINDGGQVVSYAQLDNGFTHRDAILKVGGGLVAKDGDVIAGKTLTGFGLSPTINNSGIAAYRGMFSGGSGIFADNLLLAQTGDTLAGRTFESFSEAYINNLNDVAFYAKFTDGSYGIVVANITSVPEPSSIVLAAIAIVWLGAFLSRRAANSRAP